jgi:hypothetical protein
MMEGCEWHPKQRHNDSHWQPRSGLAQSSPVTGLSEITYPVDAHLEHTLGTTAGVAEDCDAGDSELQG